MYKERRIIILILGIIAQKKKILLKYEFIHISMAFPLAILTIIKALKLLTVIFAVIAVVY